MAACAGTPQSQQPTPVGLKAGRDTDELGDPLNAYDQITNYNNYYEFSTDKEAVARLATVFPTSPWTVEVSGLVSNPKTYGLEDLLQKFSQEERIYRLRCVEAWSMVIPWTGFKLSDLLKEVEPTCAGQIRALHLDHGPQEYAGPEQPILPVALPGGPAPGRGHE